MARQIVIRDDITDEPDAEEDTFAIDGTVFKIDLTEEGSAELRRALAPYLNNARIAGRLAISGEKPQAAPRLRPRGQEPDPDAGRHTREEIDSCREFCEANGIEMSEAQGRIPVIVWKAWRTNDTSLVPDYLLVKEPTKRQVAMEEAEAKAS